MFYMPEKEWSQNTALFPTAGSPVLPTLEKKRIARPSQLLKWHVAPPVENPRAAQQPGSECWRWS